MTHDITKFFDDLHRDLVEASFKPLTLSEDKTLDALFRLMKPHFDAALADAVRRGVVAPRPE